MNPATYNFQAYYGNTFGFAFILTDPEGDPLDPSLVEGVTMRIFSPGREKDPIIEPALEQSGNILTGTLSKDDTKRLNGIVSYYELNATYPDGRVTLVNGRILSARAHTGGTQKAADLNVSVNIETLEVEVSMADSAALALNALSKIEIYHDQIQDYAEPFQGTISVIEEGGDYISLMEMRPGQLTEGTEYLGDTEIEIINITLP